MGPRSITHAKEKRKKEKKVGWVSVAAREGGDRPGRFFRLKGQVELQPIRQVGTHKACQKTEVRERERETQEGARKTRYTGDENPRDKLHRPVMLIAHLKARLQNKLLEG